MAMKVAAALLVCAALFPRESVRAHEKDEQEETK
jgi:hypothetical protein